MTLPLSSFDYDLPEALIAQKPSEPRDACRLLEVRGEARTHLQFTDLPARLEPGDLLVFNDSKVMKARLFATKPSGGKIEVLLTRPLGDGRFVAMVRGAKSLKTGMALRVADDVAIRVGERVDSMFFEVSIEASDVWAAIEAHGHVPLPPYIKRADTKNDAEVYQTIFATTPGSAAAPTAGLHFTPSLLEHLHIRGVQTVRVTLHVGPGTFLPVREDAEDDITRHKMHSEWYSISEAAAVAVSDAKRVIPVGTTALRTLEGAAKKHGRVVAGEGETDLYITPGFEFLVADALITNFHLPRSTLLILVSSFAGTEAIRDAYADAIAEHYRFCSYGDACLLWPLT